MSYRYVPEYGLSSYAANQSDLLRAQDASFGSWGTSNTGTALRNNLTNLTESPLAVGNTALESVPDFDINIFGSKTPTDKGWLDKLLGGGEESRGIMNAGGLAIAGVNTLANLAQLPDKLSYNKEALEGAKLQNADARATMEYKNKLKSNLR